jgi:transposase-like protein
MKVETGRRRRRRWSMEEKREVLARWAASGKTAGAFGAEVGIRGGSLRRWQEQQAVARRGGQRRSGLAGFVEVRVREEKSETERRAPVSCEVTARCGLTLRLPRELDDAESLRLLRLLAEVDRC